MTDPTSRPRKAIPFRHQQGLTLTELLVAAALTGVAITGAVTMANITGDSQRNQIATTQDRAAIGRVGEVLLKKSDGMTFIGITPESDDKSATLAYVDTGRAMRAKITPNGSNYQIRVAENTLTTSEEGRTELVAAVSPSGQVTMLRVMSSMSSTGMTTITMRPPAGILTCTPDMSDYSVLYPMSTVSLSLDTGTNSINESRDLPENDREKAISFSPIARGSSSMKLTYIYAGPNSNALLDRPAGSRYSTGGNTLNLSGINVMVQTRGNEASQAISSHIPLNASGQINLDGNASCATTSTSPTILVGGPGTPNRGFIVDEKGLPAGSALQADLSYQSNTDATATNLRFRGVAPLNVSDTATTIRVSAQPVRYTTAEGATLIYRPTLQGPNGQNSTGTSTGPATITVPATTQATINLTYTVMKASVIFNHPNEPFTSNTGAWRYSSLSGPINDVNYQPDMQPMRSALMSRSDLTPGTYQLYMPQIKVRDGRIARWERDPYGATGATRPVYDSASYLTPYEAVITSTEAGVTTQVYRGTPSNLQRMVFSSANERGEPRYNVTYRYRTVTTNGRKAGETCMTDVQSSPSVTSLTPQLQSNDWRNHYQTQWYSGGGGVILGAPVVTGRHYPSSTNGNPQPARGVYDVCVQLNLNHISASSQNLAIPESGLTASGVNVTDTFYQAQAQVSNAIFKNYADYTAKNMPGVDVTNFYVCASTESNLGSNYDWVTQPVSSCNSTGMKGRVLFEVTIARRSIETTTMSQYITDSNAHSDGFWYSNFFGGIDVPIVKNTNPNLYYRNERLDNYGYMAKLGHPLTNSSAAWHYTVVRNANKFMYGRSQRSGYDWRTCNGVWPSCGRESGFDFNWVEPGREHDQQILGTVFYADDNWGGCAIVGNPCALSGNVIPPNYSYSSKTFYMKPGTSLFSVAGYHKLAGYWQQESRGYWGRALPNTRVPASYIEATYPVTNNILSTP